MPFKSEAQRRLFWAKVDRGEIKRDVAQEWEAATPKDKKLPERVKHAAFLNELEKLGARAGLKLIRSLLSKGTPEALAQAERLGADPRVLKQVAGGHQVKALGRGAEGAAELVAGAGQTAGAGKRGLQVRKIYDPNSPLASPEMIKRKIQLSKELKHPALAEVYGGGEVGRGGLKQTFHEYVPGANPTRSEMAALKPELKDLLGQAKQKGWLLGDVRGANVVGGKAIDVMPFRQGEFAGQVRNVMDVTPQGRGILGMGTGAGTPGGAEALYRQAAGSPARDATRGMRKIRGARADETMVRIPARQPPRPLSPEAQAAQAKGQAKGRVRREQAAEAKARAISPEAVSPVRPQTGLVEHVYGMQGSAIPPASSARAGGTGVGGWAPPPPGARRASPSYTPSMSASAPAQKVTPMRRGLELAGAGAAGAGALGLGGYSAYKMSRRPQQQPQPVPMRKAASARRLDRAWDDGLRDELQKIADFAGLVLSQLARRQVTPPVTDYVAQLEDRAKERWQQIQ